MDESMGKDEWGWKKPLRSSPFRKHNRIYRKYSMLEVVVKRDLEVLFHVPGTVKNQ